MKEDKMREFETAEWQRIGERGETLYECVSKADIAGSLNVFADDLADWSTALKDHLLHHFLCSVEDAFFLRLRKEAPIGFQVFEWWIVREWVGAQESHELLEFHKNGEFAERFSQRIGDAHRQRMEFALKVQTHTANCSGQIEHEELLFLDEYRKDLKRLGLELSSYVDRIACQFPARDELSPIVTWRQKLNSLLVEEAKAVDPGMKFKIQQDIKEARAKIQELGGQR